MTLCDSASALVGGMLLAMLITARASDPVSFQRDIAPLLKARCAACHLTGEEPGNMAFHPAAAYQNLVRVPSIGSPLLRVKPGAPEDSYIIRKLEGTQLQVGGQGTQMPLDGGPLDPADIARIRNWISAGAPDN